MTTVSNVTPITINSLPAATAITGNEAVPIVQGGATVQTPINALPTGFGGATGSFTAGGKNVTVTHGIIVSIT